MDNEEKKKIIVNGRHYYNLEEVPEEFRALVQERLDAAKTVGPEKPADGSSRIVVHKDFKFQGGPGLSAFIKFLVKLAPPPPTTPRAPRPTGFAAPEEKPGVDYNIPQPGAIHPSSSGMFLWVIITAIAAFYWFYSSVK